MVILSLIATAGNGDLCSYGRMVGTFVFYLSSIFYIDVVVDDRENSWRFMVSYGHSKTSHLSESWATIRYLAAAFDFPWLVISDFNEILSNDKKQGGLPLHH